LGKVKDKKVLIVAYGYVFSEPPSRNTLESFLELGYCVTTLHLKKFSKSHSFNLLENIETEIPNWMQWLPGFGRRFLEWYYFKRALNRWLSVNTNSVIWCAHLSPLAAVNFRLARRNNHRVVCNVLDIPSRKYAGFYDKRLNKNAFSKLSNCYINVASDHYKALLSQRYGKLKNLPFVIHNCPGIDYFGTLQKSDCRLWLQELLRKRNIDVSENTTILLRAGAMGNFGGIEETILALKAMSLDIVFVLMGRPDKYYLEMLHKIIDENDLKHRVYLFNRPDDTEWRQVLMAADIGHLIHLKAAVNKAAESVFDLNSSLSNNRLYQYMAAELPILSYNDPRLQELYNEVDCFSVVDTNKIVDSITLELETLFNNPLRRKEMGANALKAFATKYNWENQFEKVKILLPGS
jgi:glycosyltransferase involved in cell wall biosynthesis